MAGNRVGGLKAAATNKALHGEDFYQRIGAKGGSSGNTGGFASNRELARIAGARGGRISKRRPANAKMESTWQNQNSTNSSSTLRKTARCASCKLIFDVGQLDDMQLCANCPVTSEPTRELSGVPF